MSFRGVVRRLLAFALLTAALAVYIWLVERPRMAEEAADDLLLEFEVDEVAHLSLVYPDDSIVLTRADDVDGGRWRVVEPLETRADEPTVQRLLQQIAEVRVERRIPADEAQAAATYGLDGDGNRARVSIRLRDGTDLPDIVVGGTTPVGYLAFARVEGSDDVIVTPLIFHTGVKKTLLELRDKRLFEFEVSAARTLRVSAGARRLELNADGARWRIVAPLEDRADAAEVRSLLASLANLQALDFYDDADREDAGIAADSTVVEVELESGARKGLRVGAVAPGTPAGLYVERLGDGLIAKAPDWLATRFTTDAAGLRDKHLFSCDPVEVGRIEFERRDGLRFSLVAGADEWILDPPAGGKLHQSVAARRASGVTGLAGQEIVAENVEDRAELARYGLDDPEIVVEVKRGDGSSCGRVRAGEAVDDGHYLLQREHDGVVLSAPQYLYSRLDLLPEELIVREPEPQARPDAGAPAE